MAFGAIGELAIGELPSAGGVAEVYPHDMVVATVLDPATFGIQTHVLPNNISSSSIIDAVDVTVWNVSPHNILVASAIDTASVSVHILFPPGEMSTASFIDFVVITAHSPGRTFGPAIQ